MLLARFASGISALALLSAPAIAQTTTNTNEVTQIGVGNNSVVDNSRSGNDFNGSTVYQNGNRNDVTVLQIGDFNISNSRQTGNDNRTLHTQIGDAHNARTTQSSDLNDSAIRQRGEGSFADVEQIGLRNLSLVAQGAEASASTDYDSTTFFEPLTGVTRRGDDNQAYVRQRGDDLQATIRQRGRAATGGAAADDNFAGIGQAGVGNRSTVVQESSRNRATVYQYDGGLNTLANVSSIFQGDTGAASGSTAASNNNATVAAARSANVGSIAQDGRENLADVTQGLGSNNQTSVNQVGRTGANSALVAQYGNRNAIAVDQRSAGASATVWQQAVPAGVQTSDNVVEIRQGVGLTATAPASASFFGGVAPTTGEATTGIRADVTQGAPSGGAVWNIAQVLQDGRSVRAAVEQAGGGTSALPNIVRIAQQGSGAATNLATALQRVGVGPSSASDTASTGAPGDELYFAGGARSAELVILQSGSGNQATVEQQGRGQVARIEQGPGLNNVASILQSPEAVNATAILRQTGSGNSYSITQNLPNQYIRVVQTGDNNSVTNVVQRP